jgi:very-short-patch-repair endonuclease
MDELDRLLVTHGGVLSTADAARAGVASVDLARWCRSGRLLRVRRGAFVDREQYARSGLDERFRLRVSAVIAGRPPEDLASHHAALALRSLPLWGVDLARIDVLADVAGDFAIGGVWFHPRSGLTAGPGDQPRAVSTARAVIQVAAGSGVEAGVVAADAALARGLCRRRDLVDEAATSPRIRGTRRVASMIDLCDERSESVGESRLRLLLASAGLTVRSQVRVLHRGSTVARVDFLIGDRVVVEFDGAIKYADDPSGRALFDEKRREDRLRQLGFEVVRITWSDLARPERILARIHAALTRSSVRTA